MCINVFRIVTIEQQNEVVWCLCILKLNPKFMTRHHFDTECKISLSKTSNFFICQLRTPHSSPSDHLLISELGYYKPFKLDTCFLSSTVYSFKHCLTIVPIFIASWFDIEMTIHNYLQMIIFVVPPVSTEGTGAVSNKFWTVFLYLLFDGLQQFGNLCRIIIGNTKLLLYL